MLVNWGFPRRHAAVMVVLAVRRTTGWDTLQVCYEVLITDHLEVDFGDDHQETDPHVVRVGWSLDSASFQLGNRCNKLVYALIPGAR